MTAPICPRCRTRLANLQPDDSIVCDICAERGALARQVTLDQARLEVV